MDSKSGSGDRALSKFLKLFDNKRIYVFLFTFVVLSALVFSYDYQNRSYFTVGDTAPIDLYAKRSVMPFYNRVKTRQLQEDAASEVEIRLTQNTAIAQETIDQIDYTFRQIQYERNNRLKKELEKISEISNLLDFNENEQNIAQFLLTTEPATLKHVFDSAKSIDLELLEAGVRKENLSKKYETIDLIAFRYSIDQRPEVSEAIAIIAKNELIPNMSIDDQATSVEREKAKSRITPIQENIRMNELLVEKGENLTEEDIERLKAAGYYEKEINWIIWLHSILYPFILFFFLFLYLFVSDKKEWIKSFKRYVLLFASIAIMVALSRFVIPMNNNMVPLFMFTIVLTVFFNKPFGYFITTVLVILFFPFFGMDLVLTASYLLASLVTIQLFSNFKTYADYIQKSFISAAIFSILALTLITIFPGYYANGKFLNISFLVFLNGAISGLFTLGIILLLERVAQFITPLRLIELGDSNSPLLRYLFEVAPGSYQHSIMVANIASHAAEKIKANGMLVRVGAYYHDIGKTVFPFYFTENSSGKNILDDLDPLKSVELIKGHVSNGMKLAEENSLPDGIKRFILTHHGTTRISFLLQAAQSVNPSITDDAEFRYPGPKPTSKEETILMLADSVEAAVRSLSDKDSTEIKNMVDKVISGKIKDNQLDDSSLTFKELQTVRQSFIFTLDSLYHSRITYPVNTRQSEKFKRSR
ncbi:MAG: HDIG domain-containing protein [Caldisericia bacterium]|nr:HDIG domain-containing protein [Caldisericia bacterium]